MHAPGVRRDAVEQAALLLRRRAAGSTAIRPSRRRPSRGAAGRNARWRTFKAFDIMSMPDKWEYPWFAAWDLAFHCVALAHVDPAFAKYQLILLCREWFQHPNGALAAYEWDVRDVNPPVQAWAALEVFAIDGGRDFDFLTASSTSCWSTSPGGSTARTRRHQPVRGRVPGARQHRAARPLAPAGRVHAASSRTRTGWMAFYALSMAAMATLLNRSDRPHADLIAQVPRAVRADLARRSRPGPVGRGGWLLLRPAASPRRHAQCR